ncbi:uncharacterized protein M421DRAFT_88990 [Didymella exigua CBS 183.55]|uniref:Uncharacterized protein n=1 Tax=Didymella exigua CBS 183.55 TaxID=1150837 RepID=A0A6A5RYC0_9PLEO|nr:uncharacterized protein M421DRAFT_88990 [Didymella exigua CBS 183.55]KAF1932613.1 hypothetical protein M421DRAFT_88990 [Didymella exigua CBS 183.55]
MSTKNLLRHIFRHGPRGKTDEDALPLEPKLLPATEFATNNTRKTVAAQDNPRATPNTLPPPPKTPEPFGLQDIAEENTIDTPSTVETASLTETLTSLDLEISTFSACELVHATLEEARSAVTSHLDTINTTLSLLEALDGFSATISELRGEMLDKKQACEEQMATLDAVERAIEGMAFAGELQEQDIREEDAY